MKHTYNIAGMTCNNCVATIKSELLKMPDVLSAEVSLVNKNATIEMAKHISTAALQQAISPNKKYIITDDNTISPLSLGEELVGDATWFETYKPILLIFFYITLISSVVTFNYALNFHNWMSLFMAQFFLAFSFFKFLNLTAFAESYRMYDVVAQKIKAYGFVYPFIELALGLAYLTAFHPTFTNTATIVVMGVSSIGVIKSVLNKQKIQCACLGAVFNLPMSTVTIIEDLLMIGMAIMTLLIKN